jgi:hypothetical protein
LDFSFKKNTSYAKLGIFESLKGFWTKKYATESASGAGGAPHKQRFFNIFTAVIGSKFLVISPLLF